LGNLSNIADTSIIRIAECCRNMVYIEILDVFLEKVRQVAK
jgi:hypothetical protein